MARQRDSSTTSLGRKMEGRGLVVRDATPEELAGQRPTGQEMFDAMTPAEQDAQFGPAKAKALREGRIKLEDLVDRSPMATGEDFITEKPLDALEPETTQEV